ncbi:hypothetical protein RND71_002955 [Anisodus tanguticus]|uniref:50S ribosomal protein L18 n=1 Tax=Anisodus tanguticus TaxID=243964 RepID=A0AAE1VWC7_9SOLA|nr:hypothetical protein RND71_002955 [Anisodus tanguticus]
MATMALGLDIKPLVVQATAKANSRTESAKLRNRGLEKSSMALLTERVGEKLAQTCVDLNINEISSYDRNGFARGERMQAFEIAISRHGFLFK